MQCKVWSVPCLGVLVIFLCTWRSLKLELCTPPTPCMLSTPVA